MVCVLKVPNIQIYNKIFQDVKESPHQTRNNQHLVQSDNWGSPYSTDLPPSHCTYVLEVWFVLVGPNLQSIHMTQNKAQRIITIQLHWDLKIPVVHETVINRSTSYQQKILTNLHGIYYYQDLAEYRL